jgi:16S rRNA (uracil1498-N3)-methyltransferase
MAQTFKEFVSTTDDEQKFIAYVDDSIKDNLKNAAQRGKNALVLIGPEGDFGEEELSMAIEHGFRPISLGKSRLRTETAGLAACHILNLINEE